ncbi:MAG: hypothetical protein KBD51_01720 [Candidatus Levybacteria bacterium]|nr:hypothetical protein [Candidatus Levybacteria bacterium]
MLIELIKRDLVGEVLGASSSVQGHNPDLTVSAGKRDELLERKLPELRFNKKKAEVVFDRGVQVRPSLLEKRVIVSTDRVIPSASTVRRGPGFLRA